MLKQRWLLNAALAVLAVALVVASYLGGSEDSGSADKDASRLIPNANAAAVTKFVLQGPDGGGGGGGGVSISLIRKDGAWQITAPVQARGNDVKGASMASIVGAISRGGFRAAGNDLTQFGLSPPQATLRIAGVTALIGDTEPLDGRRYVQIGEDVHLIDDLFFPFLPPTVATFVHAAPLAEASRVIGIRTATTSMRWNGKTWDSEGITPVPGPDWFNKRAQDWLQAQSIAVRPMSTTAHWDQSVEIEIEKAAAPLVFRVRETTHEIILGREALGLEFHMLRRTMVPLLQFNSAKPAELPPG